MCHKQQQDTFWSFAFFQCSCDRIFILTVFNFTTRHNGITSGILHNKPNTKGRKLRKVMLA